MEGNSVSILDEKVGHNGISHVHESFKKEKSEKSREHFFLDFLRPYLVIPDSISIEAPVPVVISGMATSSIGMRELPYAGLPFSLNGSDLRHEIIRASNQFNHHVLLLSGLCSSNDVMRGEEVQLLGLQEYHDVANEVLFILPGTHSKHILVKDNEVISFKTYITGEMFNLLSTYSVLKNSIEKSASLDKSSFKAGLKLSKENILNGTFSIRAMSLLQKVEDSRNYSLLSGLLIGAELNDLIHLNIPICLCAHENLSRSYALALQELPLRQKYTVISPKQVDESVIYGQKIILESVWNQLKNL